MEPHILYKDKDMLVVEKPAGMVTNRADTSKGAVTLQDWIDKNFPPGILRQNSGQVPGTGTASDDGQFIINGYNKLDEFMSRSGIVHRLDKETSGIIIVALNPEAFINLQNQFKDKTVKKTYQALLHGKLEPIRGEINEPIGRLPWNRMRFGVLAAGRPAKTLYKVLEYIKKGSGKNSETVSLVEVYPQTGRTHQIRVHFQYVKHPIFADALYSGRKTGRSDRKRLLRHFLHASKITLLHPATSLPLVFSSPLSQDLQLFLESFKKQHNEEHI